MKRERRRPRPDQQIMTGLRIIAKQCRNRVMPEGFWSKFDDVAEMLVDTANNIRENENQE